MSDKPARLFRKLIVDLMYDDGYSDFIFVLERNNPMERSVFPMFTIKPDADPITWDTALMQQAALETAHE